MTINWKLRALIILSVLLLPSTLFAQTDPTQVQDKDYYAGCDSSMSADECLWSPMAGGDYSLCTALGSDNQTCQIVKTDIVFGKYCDEVRRNAYCKCDSSSSKPLSGHCTFIG